MDVPIDCSGRKVKMECRLSAANPDSINHKAGRHNEPRRHEDTKEHGSNMIIFLCLSVLPCLRGLLRWN